MKQRFAKLIAALVAVFILGLPAISMAAPEQNPFGGPPKRPGSSKSSAPRAGNSSSKGNSKGTKKGSGKSTRSKSQEFDLQTSCEALGFEYVEADGEEEAHCDKSKAMKTSIEEARELLREEVKTDVQKEYLVYLLLCIAFVLAAVITCLVIMFKRLNKVVAIFEHRIQQLSNRSKKVA